VAGLPTKPPQESPKAREKLGLWREEEDDEEGEEGGGRGRREVGERR